MRTAASRRPSVRPTPVFGNSNHMLEFMSLNLRSTLV